MSKVLTKEDILNAFMNPVISRQVTQIIKQNTMGFVLEPIMPEFAEKKTQPSKVPDSKWTNKPGPPNGAVSEGGIPPGDARVNPAGDKDAPGDSGTKDGKSLERDASGPSGEDPRLGETGKAVAKDGKVWIVIKSGAKFGPFSSAELNNFIHQATNQQQMLIKNTFENRILTVDFYLKEYLPELEKRAEPESNGRVSGGDQEESGNESDNTSLDHDTVPGKTNGHATQEVNRPLVSRNDQVGGSPERNLEIEELPRTGDQKGRIPEGPMNDSRQIYSKDPVDQKRFNMYTGTVTVTEETSNPYQDNKFPGYRGPQDMYSGRGYPGDRSDHKFDFPPQAPRFPIDDKFDPQNQARARFDGPAKPAARPFNPTEAYRQHIAAPYPPIDPPKKSVDYYPKPGPSPHQGPYRGDQGYGEPNPGPWGRPEFDYGEPENIRVPVNKPYMNYPPMNEPAEPRMPRTDVAIQRIEDDTALDSATDSYHLINQLIKRNVSMRSQLEAQGEGALAGQPPAPRSQSDSMNLPKGPGFNGNHSPGASESSRNGRGEAPSRDAQDSGLLTTKTDSKNACDLYMKNIRSLNKQTTLDFTAGGIRDPTPAIPQGPTPPVPSQLRPAKTENLAKPSISSEADIHFQSAQTIPKEASAASSYLQNIMKMNKRSADAPQVSGSSSSSFPSTLPQADLNNFPPVKESRLQDSQARMDPADSSRQLQGPDDRREERQNKFIEQVFTPKDLKNAKDAKGGNNLVLDNIFERDVINIPSDYRDATGGKPPIQQGSANVQSRDETDSLKSLPKQKAGPQESKKPDPYMAGPNRPKAPGPSQQPPYGFSQEMPRYQQSQGYYSGYDMSRPPQGFPPSGYQKTQGHPQSYTQHQYDGYGSNYNKYPPQEYPPYRQQNYNYQEYDGPSDYGKYGQGQIEHAYPNRPYQNKEYQEFDGNFDRNYNRKYPMEPHGYGFNQPNQRQAPAPAPAHQYQAYKNEPQRYPYPPHQNYNGMDEAYNPYSGQRGFSQYDPPRGPSGKFPVGNAGYPSEPQGRYKGQGHGKMMDEVSYDRQGQDASVKQQQGKDSGYGKQPPKQSNRPRKPKKKDSDAPY